jgi:hypothetical protein
MNRIHIGTCGATLNCLMRDTARLSGHNRWNKSGRVEMKGSFIVQCTLIINTIFWMACSSALHSPNWIIPQRFFFVEIKCSWHWTSYFIFLDWWTYCFSVKKNENINYNERRSLRNDTHYIKKKLTRNIYTTKYINYTYYNIYILDIYHSLEIWKIYPYWWFRSCFRKYRKIYKYVNALLCSRHCFGYQWGQWLCINLKLEKENPQFERSSTVDACLRRFSGDKTERKYGR